jgi:hypothetical protein
MRKLPALMALLVGVSLRASPHLAIYDFDKVVEGTPVVHDFAITNTETTNWVVTSAETSCECVSVDGWQGEIRPGEAKKIKVSFDTSHAGIGPLVRVAFLSLAGHPRRKSLVLRGEVWPFMDCKPQLLLLTNAADGTAQGQITLTNHFDSPVTLQAVAADNPNLSLRIQTNDIGHSYSIHISAANLRENGDAGMVRIMTSSSSNTIRVYIPKNSK